MTHAKTMISNPRTSVVRGIRFDSQDAAEEIMRLLQAARQSPRSERSGEMIQEIRFAATHKPLRYGDWLIVRGSSFDAYEHSFVASEWREPEEIDNQGRAVIRIPLP